MIYQSHNKGYVALMSVLIISAVATIIAVSLLTLGSSFERTSATLKDGHSASAYASACVARALLNIRLDPLYAGAETVTLGNGECQIMAISENSGTYTIETEGIEGTVVKKNKAEVLRTEDVDTFVVTMTLQSWREVEDY